MTEKSNGSLTREDITFAAADGQIGAYLTAPSEGTGPGLIVVSYIFGIDQAMKNICDDLASRGYVTMAQNFFWRDQDAGVLVEAEVQRAIARAMRINFPQSMDDLRRGIERLRQDPRCNGKIILFGFCFGGPYAWRAACDGLGLDASVSFHGTYVSKYMKPGDQPACPVALHYGELDHLAPPEELAAVKKVADATGSEFIVHPGAGHAYMIPGNSTYNEAAARKSLEAALKFVETAKK